MDWKTCPSCGARYSPAEPACPRCPGVKRVSFGDLRTFAAEEPRPVAPDADHVAFVLHLVLAGALGRSIFGLRPPSALAIVAGILCVLEALAAVAAMARPRQERLVAVVRAGAYGLIAAFLLLRAIAGDAGSLGSTAVAMLVPLACAAGGWAVFDRGSWPRWLSLPLALAAGVALVLALRAIGR